MGTGPLVKILSFARIALSRQHLFIRAKMLVTTILLIFLATVWWSRWVVNLGPRPLIVCRLCMESMFACATSKLKVSVHYMVQMNTHFNMSHHTKNENFDGRSQLRNSLSNWATLVLPHCVCSPSFLCCSLTYALIPSLISFSYLNYTLIFCF